MQDESEKLLTELSTDYWGVNRDNGKRSELINLIEVVGELVTDGKLKTGEKEMWIEKRKMNMVLAGQLLSVICTIACAVIAVLN